MHRSMPWFLSALLVLGVGGLFAAPAGTQAGGGPYLWVASGSGAGHAAVIDTATDTVDAKVGVVGTFGTAFSPDGSVAYLTDVFRQELVVVDTATRSVVQRVAIPGGGLADVLITPDGAKGYVSVSSGLLIFDPSTMAITGSVAIGGTFATGGKRLASTPDGQKLYASTAFDVVSIAVATDTVLATIPAGSGPVFIAITPDGSRAYVTHWNSGFLSVIDTATDTALPSIHYHHRGANAGQIAINASGTLAYFVTAGTDLLYVVDLTTDSIVGSVPSGGHTIGVAVSPDESRVYVSDHFVAKVHVFDAATLAPAAPSLAVGGNTRFLAFQPSRVNVDIDIKPGSDTNSINVGSGGKVPVAILSSAAFDATTVDPLTVRLASGAVWLKGNGTPMASFTDVDGDGLTDIVVHVVTESLLLSVGDTEAVLEGETYDGIAFIGTDTVRIVPQD